MFSGEDGVVLCSFCRSTGDIIRPVDWVDFDESTKNHWSNGESNHNIGIIRSFIMYTEVFIYIISGYVITLFFTYFTYVT